MSASRELHLKVTAGSPLAEVFLIDDDFVLVERSVGDLECDVPPGVYKVKAKLADATAERLVLLDHNEALDISDDLEVGSPVPIARAPVQRARDISVGQAPSGPVAPRMADGAEIFLMTRGGPTSGGTPAGPPGISLHRLDGTTIQSLEPRAGDPPDEQSRTITIDPGPYLIRRRDRWGDVAEQCVYAVTGWQTQVFAFEEAGDEADEEAGDEAEIGRSRVSVLMAQHPFDPGDPELPLIEQARAALADNRKVATESLGELFEETDNPMLWLFGAHLMLIARDTALQEDEQRTSGRLREAAVTAPVGFDQARFDRIVDRLSEVLGPGHADVVALATQRTDQNLQSLQPVSAPPMLWRSWVLLIAASNAMPTLVPVDAWQRTLHVLPLRPFFLWAPTEEPSEISETWTRSVVSSLSSPGPAPPPGTTPRSRSSALESSGQVAAGDEVRRRVSEKLLVPRAAIDRLAEGEPL
jgi:hypothetical protein